jgi:ribosome-binding protein aMBF1 (putative translation factor)
LILTSEVNDVRLCEICGTKENYVEIENEVIQEVTLHVCESCRDDRKSRPLGDLAY